MITVIITYTDRTNVTKNYNSLAEALSNCKSSLDVGDSFRIYEGTTLLASGLMEEYKGMRL